jgi:hypothetical protein
MPFACFGGFMARMYDMQCMGHTFRLSQHDCRRFIPLLPYFWDGDIVFDLIHTPPENAPEIEGEWQYHWELTDLDSSVAKKGQGEFPLSHKGVTTRRLFQARAISLGHLIPYRHYVLKIAFTNKLGERSDTLNAATFTVKDRDDFHMEALILLMGIVIGLIVGLLVRLWTE